MTMIAPAPPQMLVSNVIQLVNESDKPFNMKYGPTQRLQLAPHGSIGLNGQATDRLFVNEEVAWHFLGKWWTNNDNPRMKVRQEEYQHLRTLYGAYEDEVLWNQNKPGLVAYTPDGNRVTTVIDDPDGVQGTTATQLGREMSLESQMAVLQDTILQMQAQLASQAVQNANQAQDTIPADVNRPAPPPGVPFPGQHTAAVQGSTVSVPVAPPEIPVPDEEPVFGNRLEPNVTTIPLEDPGEQPVPEDAPASIAHGPVPTGGRLPTS